MLLSDIDRISNIFDLYLKSKSLPLLMLMAVLLEQVIDCLEVTAGFLRCLA